MVFGILLNIWTLQALGIKGMTSCCSARHGIPADCWPGMYNGDSFGWLMDAPVTGGPYTFFNDPQYVGTTAAMLGSAVYYNSLNGYGMAPIASDACTAPVCRLTSSSFDRDHGCDVLGVRAIRGGPPHGQDLRGKEKMRAALHKLSADFVRFMK